MTGLINKSLTFIKRHSPTILTVLGSVGVIGTAVLAVTATPKAVRLIEQAEVKKSLQLGQGSESTAGKLSPKEIFLTTWKCYIPSATAALGSIFCIIGANSISKKRHATIVSAYMFLETAYKEYKNKVKELYGPEADERVETSIREDRYQKFKEADADPNPAYEEMQLFYEENNRHFFHCTKEQVLNAEHDINKILNLVGRASLYDFHKMLGLNNIDEGLGWSLEYEIYEGNVGGCQWIDFSHEDIVLEGGLECTIISIEPMPRITY